MLSLGTAPCATLSDKRVDAVDPDGSPSFRSKINSWRYPTSTQNQTFNIVQQSLRHVFWCLIAMAKIGRASHKDVVALTRTKGERKMKKKAKTALRIADPPSGKN
jgi:hypothetical protein